ncbi:MAG: hypothetical protein IT473_16240 [Lysobacter sp.]|nr:hypothetical protein [Lysobacter sp.]
MTGTHTPESSTTPSSTDLFAHDPQRDAHREQLSAMMDGMLSADESRFLLRRMQHDAELAGCWERWQLFGDAMRGQTGTALPADFSRRVARAIADDQRARRDAASAPESAPATEGNVAWRQRLRWGGGAALAATVAIAALISTRQPALDTAPAAPPAVAAHAPAIVVPAPVATSATPSAAYSAVATVNGAASEPAVLSPDSVPRKMASIALVSSSATPVSAHTTLASAPTRNRRETRAAIGRSGESAGSAATPAVALSGEIVATATVDPFGRPSSDIVAKPWPRALLPDVASASAVSGMSVDYSAGVPDFHPSFQPRADAIHGTARDSAAPSSDAPTP